MFIDSEKPGTIVRNIKEKLSSLQPQERAYYAGLSIFVAANMADLLTTTASLQFANTFEVNPFMRSVAEQCGMLGTFVTKAAATIIPSFNNAADES